MLKTQTTTMLQNRQEFLSERERSSNPFNLLLSESRPNRRPCRGRPPPLDRQSYKPVAHLAGCSAPCETRHSLLVSELLLSESRVNRFGSVSMKNRWRLLYGISSITHDYKPEMSAKTGAITTADSLERLAGKI